MKRTHKARLAAFILITLFLLIFSTLYAKEYRDLVYDGIFGDSPDHIYVDGEDFGGIFRIISAGVESFALTLTIAGYIFFAALENIIFFLILRLIAIKKNSGVSAAEYRFSLRFMLICSGITFLVSVIITGISFAVYSLLLFWQTPLFSYLIYLRILRSRISE